MRFDAVLQDLRYGARLLRRQPIFTLTAALSLAIGIGADTTIFTVANALLFRAPAAVAQPGRLVDIAATERGGTSLGSNVSYPNYLDVRRRATVLAGVYAYQLIPQPMSLGSDDGSGAERILANTVSANYFAVLGTPPAAGRLFGPQDETPSSAGAIVVLSHRFWTTRFKQAPDAVGRVLRINGLPFTIVGVAPDGFHGTSLLTTDVWLPASATALLINPAMLTRREAGLFILGGRLAPGATLSQAAAELATIARALELEYPDENRALGLRVMPASPIPGNVLAVGAFLALLMAIVSLVLIIACANVAGVLLARAAARRREIAVRLALGAGRARLARQLLTETLLLFLLGGAAGLLLARGMTTALVALLPPLPLPIDVSLPFDGHIVSFAIGLSFVSALFAGLAPSRQASKTDVVSTLKDDALAPGGRGWTRHAFVIAQVACSLVLVIGAGLFARALQKGATIDLGFDPHGVELAELDLGLGGSVGRATWPVFTRELLDRLRKLPDVQAATVATSLPLGGVILRVEKVNVPGATPPAGKRAFEAYGAVVEPGYFATLKIPLVSGRDFGADDVAGTQAVVIVSEAAARTFWPGQEPIGKTLTFEGGFGARLISTTPGAGPAAPAVTTAQVVGVARDVRFRALRDEKPGPFIYAPLQQQLSPRITLVARTTHGRRIAGEIRALVSAMNPNLPVIGSATLEDYTALGLVPQRVAASVAGTLGLVGLLLAAVGIYGVMAYAVTRRTREIGIRVALGARRADVAWMVLRQGGALAIAGSAIGLGLAAAGSRLLTAFLFGIPPIDVLTFGGAAALFLLVGLAACYVPARRALDVSAIEALRRE